MSATIVITGTAGFLGSHLLNSVLRLTDFDVIAVDSLRHNGRSRNVTDVLDALPQHAGRVQFITHDLRAPFHQTDLRSFVNADYIIHAAAYSQVGNSIIDPAGFIDNNVQGVLNVLEVARLAVNLRRFVLISTDEVYGASRDIFETSMTDYRPSSPYAASKACQELIAHSYEKTYHVPLTTYNISNMFGPRQSQLAFIPQIIRKLRRTIDGYHQRIDVHVDGNGHVGGRNYSFVEDVAYAITRDVQGDFYEYGLLDARRHIPGHDFIDNETVVRSLHQIAGCQIPIDELIRPVTISARRPGHDIDYGRLVGDTAWKPYTSRVNAFTLTWDWYVEHPDWLEL